MRGIYSFLKSTFIGGLIVLLPIAVLLALVGWAVNLAVGAIVPLLHWLPDTSVGGVSLTVAIALGSIIALCFFAGVVAQTALIRKLGGRAERLALFVPGYSLMKSVGANFIGVEGKKPLRTVLVRFEVTWQLGFLIETLPDGRQVIYVPNAPKALEGTLHVVTADRVQILNMSVSHALDVLSCLGNGFKEAWDKEAVSGEPANVM